MVLIRTGTLRYWGEDGADHEKIRTHDSAGITLETAKYLVERSRRDDDRLGHQRPGSRAGPEGSGTFIPVHKYLLIEQGVHIGEFHYLEDLAQRQGLRVLLHRTTNKIAGTVAGFTLRPVALH